MLHNVLGLNNILFITIYTINRPGPDSKLKVYMSHPVKEKVAITIICES